MPSTVIGLSSGILSLVANPKGMSILYEVGLSIGVRIILSWSLQLVNEIKASVKIIIYKLFLVIE